MPHVFDIETDGLYEEASKIHCNFIHDLESGEVTGADPVSMSIPDSLKILEKSDMLIGHNIIGYDLPVIHKLYPKFKEVKNVRDTLVMCQLLFPEIKDSDFTRVMKGTLPAKLMGSHSLEAWGYRLGVYKGVFGKSTDWKTWTPEMSKYCKQDVNVNVRLYEFLMSRNPTLESIELEMAVAKIISRQVRFGVGFDMATAQRLHSELLGKLDSLGRKLSESFPGFWKPANKTFTPKRDNAKLGYIAGAELTKIEWTEFKPSSSEHVAYFLIRYCGWKPTVFTDKAKAPAWLAYYMKQAGITNTKTPTVNDEVLAGLTHPDAKPLAEYAMIQKRLSQLADGASAWLQCVRPDTFRIHGSVMSCGAVTRRMRHFGPNLAQVPNGHAPYGPECRALFIAHGNHMLVGCDASGLELRCLAHYMAPFDGGEYVKVVLYGKSSDGTDVHSRNAKALGISRDLAKRWIYAFLYGAGNQLLGEIAASETGFAGDMQTYGTKLRAKFLKSLPALKKLIDAVKAKAKSHKYLKALDGAKLTVRSQHSALNTLFQSAGALIMKKALVLADNELQKLFIPGKDYEFVLNVHDEFQVEVMNPDNAETVGKILRQGIIDAGLHFNLKCPLDGEYKIGKSWKETH